MQVYSGSPFILEMLLLALWLPSNQSLAQLAPGLFEQNCSIALKFPGFPKQQSDCLRLSPQGHLVVQRVPVEAGGPWKKGCVRRVRGGMPMHGPRFSLQTAENDRVHT